MKNGPKPSSQPSVARNRRWRTIFIAGLLVLVGVIAVAAATAAAGKEEPAAIVIRIDDIQDYAFKEAQLFLLDVSATSEIPVSLCVIAGMFGEDTELVQRVRLSLKSGSEIAVHGWRHEDLATLPFEDQVRLLSKSRNRIGQTLDVNTSVLVPPMFSFSEDTVAAMRQEGYSLISTIKDYVEPGLISGVVSLPATVELSDYANGTWKMKSLDSVVAEVSNSVSEYGYAVIVTHPQEFMKDVKLNRGNIESYRVIIDVLKEKYSFETLESIGGKWPLYSNR